MARHFNIPIQTEDHTKIEDYLALCQAFLASDIQDEKKETTNPSILGERW